jgi:hypothetical protein
VREIAQQEEEKGFRGGSGRYEMKVDADDMRLGDGLTHFSMARSIAKELRNVNRNLCAGFSTSCKNGKRILGTLDGRLPFEA